MNRFVKLLTHCAKWFQKKPDHSELMKTLCEELVESCQVGDLNKLRRVLTSPDLPVHPDIHYAGDICLRSSCFYGHLDIVKYLLTSGELSDHADIDARDSESLSSAARQGHLDIVKYLLTSPELTKHIDLGDGSVLFSACAHPAVIRYLIIEQNMKKPTDFSILVDDPKFQEAAQLFKMRDEQQLLSDTISNNEPSVSKKGKI